MFFFQDNKFVTISQYFRRLQVVTKLWPKIAHNVFHKTIKFVEVPTAVKLSAWATNFLILSGWSRAVFLKLLE